MLFHPRGDLDGGMDAYVGATSADVAVHGVIDLRVGGFGRFGQERSGLHDLSALAVAALGDVEFLPCDLTGMRASGAKAFDGRDLLARDGAERSDATADGFAVQMHGAGATEPHATAE